MALDSGQAYAGGSVRDSDGRLIVVVEDSPASTAAGAAVATHSVVSVGVASGVVIDANADRRELILQNDHATQVIYLRLLAAAAVLNQGVRLDPGATFITDLTAEIRAIATGAATTLLVTEIE